MADWAKKILIRVENNYEMMYPYNCNKTGDIKDMATEKQEVKLKEKKV